MPRSGEMIRWHDDIAISMPTTEPLCSLLVCLVNIAVLMVNKREAEAIAGVTDMQKEAIVSTCDII